jgi:hypothetical protein
MNLDGPVPHTGLAKEGVDLDLVKLIQTAILDHLVGLVNQLLDTGAKLYKNKLHGRIR